MLALISGKYSANDDKDQPGPRRSFSLPALDSESISTDDDEEFGWFEDLDSGANQSDHIFERFPSPVTDPPAYVLESSLSYQELWYQTAGRRPRQPVDERIHFENLWGKVFETSESAAFYERSNCKQDGERVGKAYEGVLFRGKAPHSGVLIRSFTDFTFINIGIQVRVEEISLHI